MLTRNKNESKPNTSITVVLGFMILSGGMAGAISVSLGVDGGIGIPINDTGLSNTQLGPTWYADTSLKLWLNPVLGVEESIGYRARAKTEVGTRTDISSQWLIPIRTAFTVKPIIPGPLAIIIKGGPGLYLVKTAFSTVEVEPEPPYDERYFTYTLALNKVGVFFGTTISLQNNKFEPGLDVKINHIFDKGEYIVPEASVPLCIFNNDTYTEFGISVNLF